MTFAKWLTVGCLASSSIAFAWQADKADPAKPADNAGVADEIAKLIKQLGDDNFDVREKAAGRLAEIGKPALPALKEATKSDDVETRQRAKRLVEKFEPAPKPAQPKDDENVNPFGGGAGGIRILGPGQVQMRVQVLNGNAVKQIHAEQDGKKIDITEDGDGIKMKVTEKDAQGKETVKEFNAKNEEELKKNHPEAHEIYKKHAGGVQFNVGGAGFGGPGIRPLRIQPLRPNRLMEDQRRRMEEMLKPFGPQGEELLKQLKQMEELQQKLFEGGNLGDVQKRMEELLKKQQEAARGVQGLPNSEAGKPVFGVEVGDLDPALKAQLGLDKGVAVRRVLPGSRADKLGVQEHDILQRVNGRDIDGALSLRLAVEQEKKLSLEGLRAGKPLKLEEKE